MCFPVFLVLRICSEFEERGKGVCAHTQLRARNTLGCWIMRVDRAELSLHITIILSSSQLPQHPPWRCDISILLEFNPALLNRTVAYRPFPNTPSPILITLISRKVLAENQSHFHLINIKKLPFSLHQYQEKSQLPPVPFLSHQYQ